jgi:hypothetical protein
MDEHQMQLIKDGQLLDVIRVRTVFERLIREAEEYEARTRQHLASVLPDGVKKVVKP